MIHLRRIAAPLLLLLASALAGCASGPKYAEVKNSIPELSSEQGRIYFYRTNPMGAAVQPNIRLNDVIVGEMVPRGFFFVDRPPGNYLVAVRTEAESTVQFTLDAGQTRYVRGYISVGFFIGRPYVELVDMKDALVELQDLGYTGTGALSAPVASPATPASEASAQPVSGGGVVQMKDLEGLLTDQDPGKK